MPVVKRDVMFKSGETFAAAWAAAPKSIPGSENEQLSANSSSCTAA